MGQTPSFIQTLVTSTRIRLARNFAAYPFPDKLTQPLADEISYLVGKELDKHDTFEKREIGKLSKAEATLLQEQHLISPALIRRKNLATAFISADRSISVMVNEEDHLRLQYICKGFDLYKAYEILAGVDEGLNSTFHFAYDHKLGYLTACPSNLGTGMRASVMMFLPGLERNGELKAMLPKFKAGGITVRGSFGEGTAAEGYSYQVSNERTLGVSESEILEDMVRMTMNLSDLELRAREQMLANEKIVLKDKCLRAYGALTNCAICTQEELTAGMAEIKLGMALGFFKARNIWDFNDFLADMRPASFRLENGLQGASAYDCDLTRAQIVNRVLPELVVRAD